MGELRLVRKRDGRLDAFEADKIIEAIFKAAKACGGQDRTLAARLGQEVIAGLETSGDDAPEVESIQDRIEKVLIERGHAQTAKAFILYRQKRTESRQLNALIGATIDLFNQYLEETDWQVRENANTQKSINGLNNYVRETFTKKYWLHEIYPTDIRKAHESGALHIHDLGFMGPYCAGWDLRQLLTDGFGGVPGKVESRPPKHFHSALGQITNSTFTTQGETAGAQAWSSFDTYLAPFIRYDNLDYKSVKQGLQEFVFNLNVPTRVGFQCPFSNLTFDLRPPKSLREQPVVCGGQLMNETYGEFQAEMDVFNRAFCEVMLEGDAKGRVFTFPIPTINVTSDFDWDAPSTNAFMDITCKYGIPYFANYVNSDLSPEDALSMCCRLRLDTKELRKRGGGLFGSNPLTGSIGVVTLNLPRIGFLAKSKEDFLARVRDLAEKAKTSLEIKRKVVERQTEQGMYPFSGHLLRHVKQRFGGFWANHFSTIGVVGMNEALLNFNGKDIADPENRAFALEVLETLREQMSAFQDETGNYFNLEATPAEGTAYRLARLDKQRYPEIVTASEETPYYTNSTHLPACFSYDLFEVLEHQDALQCQYTGGTVLHAYLGQSLEDGEACKRLIRSVFQRYKLPYLSLTPTFSVCPEHGLLRGQVEACPCCGRQVEVYSRVVGYLRPVQNWNAGKKQEFRDRVMLVH